MIRPLLVVLAFFPAVSLPAAEPDVPLFGIFEKALHHGGTYRNPYVDASATVVLAAPDGSSPSIPLFWDGGDTWRLRFSPALAGKWTWRTVSEDGGLNGKSGAFIVVPSHLKGSIRPRTDAPLHFERQDGSPFWFLGDTAWALYTDFPEEKLDRRAVLDYIDARAEQGFNVVHSMLLSEAGWGNRGGPPFDPIATESLNPGYWQEVDARLRHVNDKGMVAGLALAWGDKGRGEPYAWRRFPSPEARLRYARYIAARYGAFNVYFLVSGEWHAEVNRSPGKDGRAAQQQFVDIGNTLRASDPHARMIGIHPMTADGSVREFVGTPWMSFGDYQQNYSELHGRILQSRAAGLPCVNSEYAYFLRDQNGDGLVDKDNSFDLDSIRHASWDIAMAGGYLVTGFGTTYFGGNRDPGPFDLLADKNGPWEEQVRHLPALFTALRWWNLQPHDDWIEGPSDRDGDGRRSAYRDNGSSVSVLAPPSRTYWLLADPGKTIVAYARGGPGPYRVVLDPSDRQDWQARLYDPRTGRFQPMEIGSTPQSLSFQLPDSRDWVLVCTSPAGTPY
ncbi:MAG: apiosidase-like domain-containing protein [Thermoguttaceae bacterium]